MEERFQDVLKRTWPDWDIVDEIGEGAFGTVYRAVRHDMAGTVESAIKVIAIPQEEEEVGDLRVEGYTSDQTTAYFRQLVEDYMAEIRLMASVKGYTNIVVIDDYKVIHDEIQEVWYIFIRMELLNKVDFQNMEENEIIRLGIDLCTALEVCREKKIVHRDIKPDNILVNSDGHYKLGDFGVARNLDRTSRRMSVKGTPNFMAPEVYKAELNRSDINAAAKADIYSLGLVLYWISNGARLPFMPEKQIPSPADREAAFICRMNGEQLPRLTRISAALQNIILKSCAYAPKERYQSAADMRRDLIKLRDEKKPAKKKWIPVFLTAAVVTVLGAVFYFAMFAGSQQAATGLKYKCGNSAYWSLDKNGQLIITGTGKMMDYAEEDWAAVPWSDIRDRIRSVVIEQNITNVGSQAFRNCRNLTGVTIPDSVTVIGNGAFSDWL